MRLCLVRPGGCDFKVFVVPSDYGPCRGSQVLEQIRHLEEVDQRLQTEVWAILYERVPWEGPAGHSKQLRDNIWQFSFGRLPGPGFRILWFHGDPDTNLICSYAFVKTSSTPDGAIDRAVKDRARYKAAMAAGTHRVEEMKPEDL